MNPKKEKSASSCQGFQVQDGQLVYVREHTKKGSGRVLQAEFANSADQGTHIRLVHLVTREQQFDLKADEVNPSTRSLTGWSLDGYQQENLRIRSVLPREARSIKRALRVLGVG